VGSGRLAPPRYLLPGCLEHRLKRPLTIDDFTVCPVNRQAYAGAGKLSLVLEHEQRIQERQKEARRGFLDRQKATGLKAEQLELFDENA
jgi:hypothetical protein